MKYLNKVIFINSANIPYAEIAVDGNVHFTGTQGVGKSTVLRALLFFYNADKHRLGIQQGQKPFDEFYFRQSNSYILYEVMRENGAYTILVGRYQGRASWRFIDAPYKREWLITEDKQVLSDWIRIRERIDKNVAVSARIESGAMFKDIIFGNTPCCGVWCRGSIRGSRICAWALWCRWPRGCTPGSIPIPKRFARSSVRV